MHYYTFTVIGLQITNNTLTIALVTANSTVVMWMINFIIWLFTLICLLIACELIQLYQPLFPSLTNPRMRLLKFLVVTIYMLANGCRAVKDLLYTSIQQNNFFAVWNRYGNPVLSVAQVIFNIGSLIFMFWGIYRFSSKKSSSRQIEFIKAKYSLGNMFLIVFALLVLYMGGVAILVAQLDREDPFIHRFVLKLDILLLQPMALMIFIYLKLYYLLLEIFAKKEIWSTTNSVGKLVVCEDSNTKMATIVNK
ncbi:hypothetical protein HDV01_003765 [Terramyces sp. JEL0728]|nr:hypothetical protein HDV01_003765 [Terramyces sp. JEL0728]